MRLTQVKLAGFKSFVDPTAIATPGQLVGIVGPNGCGKSNVIDAVRWVLGESKASALRGESMQDVIFNGAGDRKPVGRASVELIFDNSAGRIGGQWGQFVELSIRRVLTRDGDSTYYINNIPVRRRDIHDLFLGTGLGPRAYAIIEQGMISRVIEAKPEELRIFLEEAAGVSKYKERRKETEGRIADARENLARVEDIRIELGNQLARLEQQAKVAAEYRDLESRLKQSQHMMWFARQQDAARARERHTAEVAALTTALEAVQAELREAEAALEHLRTGHFAAGDAMHDRQGTFYAANAEVTRLEQQLSYARESETRIAAQVQELEAEIAGLVAQQRTFAGERASLAQQLDEVIARHARALDDQRGVEATIPDLTSALEAATAELAELQQRIARAEQDVRIGETRRDHHLQSAATLGERHMRLVADIAQAGPAASDPIAELDEQLALERRELADREARVTALAATVQALQASHRAASDAWHEASRTLADLDAHRQALAALQAKIGHGGDAERWRQHKGLAAARQLWQVIDIDAAWENALEAVLRERLEALEVGDLADVAAWLADASEVSPRIALFSPHASAPAIDAASDALWSKLKIKDARFARFVADGVAHVRCRASLDDALSARASLAAGEAFVTPQGHLVSAAGVALFAPDSEIHGVIARQRELDRLAAELPGAQQAAGAARVALDAAEASHDAHQQDYHAEGLAVASQQRRVHDLELELVDLRKEAEAKARRLSELARERDEVSALVAAELAAREGVLRGIADLQSGLHDEIARRQASQHARNERDVALSAGRERLRDTERAAQEAGFAERSARERIAEAGRRDEALAQQVTRQRELLARLTGERASIDWTPVEEALQRQLATRTDAERALAAARDALEALGAKLREGEEARMTAEHKLEPARARIQEMQLKEQAAVLAEQQFTEQLTEAQADIAALPDALKAWGRTSLPAEIARINTAIAGLGAVNMAALDELTQSQERKDYLDRQSADLTEALTTLETAIRQIDRESRELLQQTFDAVNANFAVLFPTLFGGGEARLVLTGEEILDSGVQIFAQPPGKRNASIHLLSGGEKALTAISLVFALFRLNPAPFCLLDEVDAPLDDPNTERFCRMVREMSDETQFLFISHNKITMEMANQLIGITMPEPGVSRVVAVDIAEALTLAESNAVAAA
ncbi:MAG: chromosome segregation protein SMC [Betaproteobacteria bacterium]